MRAGPARIGVNLAGRRQALGAKGSRVQIPPPRPTLSLAPRKGWPKTLTVRQVTRRRDDHQTPILTSRSDLSAITVAHRMLVATRDRSTLVTCPLPRACH